MGLSVLVPILVMVIAYYIAGIYPGSNVSILASDAFAQYSNFHASFKQVLEGKQSIFYSWSGSLGLNYWALAAYYLNGIFTPLVIFFDNVNMPDTLYYLTLIKFGASGLSFWIFAHNTYKLNRWIITALSISYSLMSYALAYSEVIMWLDTFVYLPLIILGIHRLMDKNKPVLLFISYLLLFLSNFYMAFMVGVFSFLYFFARTFTNWHIHKKSIFTYFITSILAGGASMVVILPTVLDLSANGESLTQIQSFLTKDTGAWDFVAKNLVGIYDTSKYNSMPFIYIGLIPLLLCLYYFVSKKFALKNKLIYGSLFLILIASVYISALNLFWHGMHSPNMFLFRFSFLISFLVILLAGYSLEALTKEDSNTVINIILSVGAIFLIFILLSNKKRYGVVTTESLVGTLLLLAVYLLIWLIYVNKAKFRQAALVLLFVVMVGEAAFNAQQMIAGISRDWGYTYRKFYQEPFKDVEKLVSQVEKNESFYRLENIEPTSANDSFRYGYHGVSMFSSIRNRHSSQYLNTLGYRSLGTNLQIQYMNNTLLADTLVGMKYNLSKNEKFNKFGYEEIGKSGKYTLYENKYALPLGIMTDDAIFDEGAVRNQTELFNHLSDNEGEIFSFGDAPIVDSKDVAITESGETIVLGEQEISHPRNIKLLVTVPEKTQGYVSIVPTDFSKSGDAYVKATINGNTTSAKISDYGQYYDIGYHDETTAVEIELSFDGEAKNIEIFRPNAVFLDTEKFRKDVEKMQKNGVDFITDGRKAKAEVQAEKDEVLLTTIPYDKGWSVYIDGQKENIESFKDAFLAVSIPKGQHTVEFIYLPQGFKIGISLFAGCIISFALYVYWLRRKGKKLTTMEDQGDANI
ncbi:YfhO family protein [Enterococcus sp. S22(2020)]|nr:YfhO family protein [Enterococcus sp. S22(2020)]